MPHYTERSERQGGALFLYASCNKKLSRVVKVPYTGPAKAKFPFRPTAVAPFCSSTYVSIDATCPDSCKFKRAPDGSHGGCYVDAGKTVHTIRRLDAEAAPFTGDDVIVSEADVIDRSFPKGVAQDGARGGRDLRLHVGGDTTTPEATAFLGDAAARWRARGGGDVWTYTHRWKTVPRSAWGPAVAVLASVENYDQMFEAAKQGYAPAVVVTSHKSHKAKVLPNGVRLIPCPAEFDGGPTCVECRLCLAPDALFKRRAGISFALHGVDKKHALVRLGLRGVQRRLL